MTCSIMYRILFTCVLNSFSQSRRSRHSGFLMGVIMALPTYPLSPIWLPSGNPTSTDDSSMQCASWRLPSTGSDIHESSPQRLHATWTFFPVVFRLPEYSSRCPRHDQQGSSV